jgi:hypothetical protein
MDQVADLAKKGRAMPWLGRPLTFFLPFIDTPLNIFKEAIVVTPIGAFLAVVDATRALRRKVYAGSLSKEAAKEEAELLYNRARLVQDITNQSIGLMVYMAISSFVEGDDDDEDKRPAITGSMPWKSTEKGERDNAYAVMPPLSIRIGSIVFSYKRVEPFATVLGSFVDLALATNRNDGIMDPAVFSQWMAGFKDQLTDKTFLQGFSNLAEAWANPDRFGTRLTANVATGFILNIIRQPIREADSYLRESKPAADDGFFTAVGKSVGYSVFPQTAPAKIDVWGNAIRTNRGEQVGGTAATDALFRILDPTNLTVDADIDPLDAWIFRHNQETPDSSERVSITPLPNSIRFTVPGEKKQRNIALSNEEWIEANTNAGKSARIALGDGWETRPRNVETKEYIEDVYREFQSQERARLKGLKLSQGLPPME